MLLELTLTELLATLKRKQASPVELMQQVLARIDATGESLNAVIAVRDTEQLLDDARAAEQRIAAGDGRALEGIPLGVKDLEDVAGMVTSNGSRLFSDNLVDHDSIQVERLRQAGAIVVGKTNTPEFGHAALTKNLLFGPTRSPWDAARTPGGSSGGSAAALAGGVLPLVTASDGGGSIRIPASFCGAYGLKTSQGRVPLGPWKHWDLGRFAVYGPLTRSVADAALLLDLTCGPDLRDPGSLPHPGLSYVEAVELPLPAGLRIAWSPDLGHIPVQADIAACVAVAAAVFEAQGHRVEPIDHGPPEMGAEWALMGAWELNYQIASLVDARPNDVMRTLMRGLQWSRQLSPTWWSDANARRNELVAWAHELFQEYDLLLTPTLAFDPPAAKGPFPTEVDGRAMPLSSAGAFTMPFNLCWLPAATVRAGFSEAGLPVGLQIVGPQHRDDLVLQASRCFERACPWQDRWPSI